MNFIFDYIHLFLAFLAAIPTIILLFTALKAKYLSRKTLNILCRVLRDQHFVSNEYEIKFLINNYVEHNFTPLYSQNENSKITTNSLITRIKKSDERLFVISGKPALGKTVSIRYMYKKIAKSRQCVYIPMKNISNLEAIRTLVEQYRNAGWIKKSGKLIVFFDGFDEAYKLINRGYDFETLFIEKSEIIENIFKNEGFFVDKIIVSTRPEIIEQGLLSMSEKSKGDIIPNIYNIQPMDDKKVIKIFKSMKRLRKLDIKYDKKTGSDRKRHYYRYPSNGKEAKIILSQLREFLNSTKESIFTYPMFIRYAYPFISEYNKKEDVSGNIDLINRKPLASDMLLAFETLLEAICKWEYRVLYDTKAYKDNIKRVKRDHFKDFHNEMMKFCDGIISHILNSEENSISRVDLLKILDIHPLLGQHSIAISHCLMIWDKDVTNFEFAHTSFFEYFTAIHLDKNTCSIDTRDEYLKNTNIRDFYFSIICRNDIWNKSIFDTINYDYGVDKKLYPRHLVKFCEKNHIVNIKDNASQDTTGTNITEIYTKIPIYKTYSFRGYSFNSAEIKEIISTLKLDLSNKQWDSLEYANGIIHYTKCKHLIIAGMPLSRIGFDFISKFVELVTVKVHDEIPDKPEIQDISALEKLTKLNKFRIYTEKEFLCTSLAEAIINSKMHFNEIHVKTTPYCSVYKVMENYNAKRKIFLLSERIPEPIAKEYFFSFLGMQNDTEISEIINAVYSMEKDSDILGLDKNSPYSTYWTALSLAASYRKIDSRDRNKEERTLLEYIYQYINLKDIKHGIDSMLDLRFDYDYGRNLISYTHKEYDKGYIVLSLARIKLNNTISIGDYEWYERKEKRTSQIQNVLNNYYRSGKSKYTEEEIKDFETENDCWDIVQRSNNSDFKIPFPRLYLLLSLFRVGILKGFYEKSAGLIPEIDRVIGNQNADDLYKNSDYHVYLQYKLWLQIEKNDDGIYENALKVLFECKNVADTVADNYGNFGMLFFICYYGAIIYNRLSNATESLKYIEIMEQIKENQAYKSQVTFSKLIMFHSVNMVALFKGGFFQSAFEEAKRLFDLEVGEKEKEHIPYNACKYVIAVSSESIGVPSEFDSKNPEYKKAYDSLVNYNLWYSIT